MTCEAELHGSVTRMVYSILSLIGKASVTKVNPELNFFVCAGSFQFKFQARSCHSLPRPLLSYGRMLQRIRPRIRCDSESLPQLNLGSRERCSMRYSPRAAQPVGRSESPPQLLQLASSSSWARM